MIKVMLVDDQNLVRKGVRSLLELSEEIEVIAEASDGIEAIQTIPEVGPDVVLLDMRMPSMDGMEVLRQLRKNGFTNPVAMLTTSSDERDLVESLRSGAQGYLLKDMEPDQLVVALRDIVAGKTVVAPDLAQVLARVVQGDSISPAEESPFAKLTPRENEILALLAEGQSNKVIARNLGISDGTVKLHVKSILRKLGIHSRVEAAVIAVEQGLRTSGRGGD